jgi:hypothetical protein
MLESVVPVVSEPTIFQYMPEENKLQLYQLQLPVKPLLLGLEMIMFQIQCHPHLTIQEHSQTALTI